MKSRSPKFDAPAPADANGPPPAQDLLRRLETLENEAETLGNTGHQRWMIPYADLLTLLLGLFLVLMTTMRTVPPEKSRPEASSRVESPAGTAATGRHADRKPASTSLAKSLQTSLAAQPEMRGVEIREQERGVVISLKESILFTPGSADLSPAARKTLDRLAAQLSRLLAGSPRPIRVEGHTDDTPIATGRYPSNWELSTARATNIVRYLAESRRFSPEDLSAAGYGEFHPVENNSSIEGKRKNRRVDIVILNGGSVRQEPPKPW